MPEARTASRHCLGDCKLASHWYWMHRGPFIALISLVRTVFGIAQSRMLIVLTTCVLGSSSVGSVSRVSVISITPHNVCVPGQTPQESQPDGSRLRRHQYQGM